MLSKYDVYTVNVAKYVRTLYLLSFPTFCSIDDAINTAFD